MSRFRVMVALPANQIDYFTKVGSSLELIYRQIWYEPMFHNQNGHREEGSHPAAVGGTFVKG